VLEDLHLQLQVLEDFAQGPQQAPHCEHYLVEVPPIIKRRLVGMDDYLKSEWRALMSR
jgi:hypothetical protein